MNSLSVFVCFFVVSCRRTQRDLNPTQPTKEMQREVVDEAVTCSVVWLGRILLSFAQWAYRDFVKGMS